MSFVSEKQRKWYWATHSGGSLGRNVKERVTQETSQNIPPKVAISTAITLSSSIVPHLQIIYTAYKIVDTGIKLYNLYNQLQHENKFLQEELESLIRDKASREVRKVSEPIASSIAQEIRKSAEDTGIIKQISENTKIDKDIYSSMLAGTLKEQMLSGIEDLTSYTIGGLI